MPAPLPLMPDDPAEVGPYLLEGRLGSGGQGVVYTGRTPDGPLVAVKLLHSHLISDEQARTRFLREVQTAKRVAPFCTAQLLDSGFAGARPYIVSEYVDGPSLQESVKESGPRGVAALQRLAINTATALAAIHSAGVVHRDFKPGNVLLGPDGPVVIDFGIAKALDVSQSLVSSQPIGSPAYMAPEQISDEEVGPPADLFAWGATMYYAATGRRAFPGETIPSTLHSVLRGEPDLSGLDGWFGSLLRECLDKEPARRPTAAQVVERLSVLPAPLRQGTALANTAPGAAVAGQTDTGPATVSAPVTAPDSPTPDSPKPGRRRTPAIVSASAAALVAALGVGIGFHTFSPAAVQVRAAGPTPPATPPPPTPTPSTATPTPETYELLASRLPGKASDLTPDSPARTPRTSQPLPRKENATPGSSPTTRTKTPKPTRTPTPKPTRRPDSTKQPSPQPTVQPSTGSITWNDASAYCKAQGSTTSFFSGWSNMKCTGSDAPLSLSAVCKWKYPSYSQAVGVPPDNPYMPTATCDLS